MDQETLTNESGVAPVPLSALQPVRQPPPLPSEILVQIFLLSLPPLKFPQAPHKTALALVCRLWNAIIESTPILWSGISTTDSTTYVEKSLIKSAEHLIDVGGEKNYDEHMDGRSYTSCGGACCELLPAFASHAGRWRHVGLMVRPQRFTPSVRTFSSLRSLVLDSYSFVPIDAGFSLMLNAANSPNLREVRLQAAKIRRWDLISFPPSLSKLEIRNIWPGGLCPSLNRFLSILAACPNLTVLRLEIIRGCRQKEKGDENGHTNAPAAIVLPALQELKLNRIPGDYLRELLARLSISDECTVSVIMNVLDVEPNPGRSFLTPALSRHLERFQPAKVTLTFVPRMFRLIVDGQRWHMEIETEWVPFGDAVEWFSINCNTANSSNDWSGSETLQAGSITFNSPPITLKLGKEHEIHEIPVSFESLGAVWDCQYIRRIEIGNLSPDEQSAFFWYLSGPEDPNPDQRPTWSDYLDSPGLKKQTTGVWLFPGLCEMVLKGADAQAMRALLCSIKGRWTNGATAETPGMRARLERIEFVDDDEPTERDNHLGVDAQDAERLILEILDALDDDVELWWRGKRVSKA